MIQLTVQQVGPWARQQKLDSPGAQPVVLDVREAWEVQTASVADDEEANGFKLVTMPMRTVPARCLELDRDQPIACLCHHGGRSMQVAQFLLQNGFTNVVNIQGGIHAWSSELDASIPQY
ncbi:MAG TPA: rhodanese-like domain-containing protein [Burkholderiaceae bacterium]|nr:rhodanese-like domain-containing protein [Burkholderiaceae bacterium]